VTSFEWTGVNGVVWDLGGGPVSLAPGIMGLGLPGTDQYVRSSSALDGQRLTGSRTQPRRVFWPLAIRGANAAEWLTTSRAFFAGLSTDRTGTFKVTANDGQVRSIPLRLLSQDEQVFDSDPDLFAREVVGVDLVADDPFWRGPQVLQTFQTAQVAAQFFETAGTHVLNLMSSSTTASATVSNPGEVDAWPLWTITGPASSFTIGVGSTVISATMSLLVGESVQVSTDPTVQVARKFVGGVSTVLPFSAFTSIQFARVPSGESVPLTVEIQGAGSVSVQFDPGFRRAF
jgi:hypothetical protein